MSAGGSTYLELKMQPGEADQWLVYDVVTDDVSLEESYEASRHHRRQGWDALLERMQERLRSFAQGELMTPGAGVSLRRARPSPGPSSRHQGDGDEGIAGPRWARPALEREGREPGDAMARPRRSAPSRSGLLRVHRPGVGGLSAAEVGLGHARALRNRWWCVRRPSMGGANRPPPTRCAWRRSSMPAAILRSGRRTIAEVAPSSSWYSRRLPRSAPAGSCGWRARSCAPSGRPR